jgi:hypothetical protein
MAKPDQHAARAGGARPAQETTAPADKLPRERAHFRSLLVSNPNYFGNLEASPFPPVLSIQADPTYEEIGCVGFHPQENRLDAVVFIKQSAGYGGGICSRGTPEYVRFYLSFDGGASWVDQGVTSFTAHDVPAGATGGRRLEYAVSLAASPPRRWCTVPNVILARAILSWNDLPPANAPDHRPVWGDIHDTHIQVDPIWILKWLDLFRLGGIKLTPALAQSIDLEQAVAAAPKKALAVAELHELYKGKGVEPHRYAMAEVKRLMKTPELTAGLQHPFYTVPVGQLGFDIADIIDKLAPTDGSTVYEELDCVGLETQGLDSHLVAVLRIKRSSGFSGGPCTDGSREYVTFWGDFDNDGTYETCLGTASVQVFDLDVPREGLEYSVRVRVDLNPYRRPCGEGARVVPIRAILSWNDVPECADPGHVPTWGNREETLILVPPGRPIDPLDYRPFLYDISGVAVCAIDQATGLAAGDRPFGGRICIAGSIPAALADMAPDKFEYKVTATQGATTITLADPFPITVHEGTGPGTAISYPISQVASPDGFFTYRENGNVGLSAVGWREVSSPPRFLAHWHTSETLTGTWRIDIVARLAGTVAPIYTAATTVCVDGTTRSSVNVTLDQEKPVGEIQITGYSDASGFHPALPCGDFTTGVTIHGTWDVTDNMGVGGTSITVEPSGSASVVQDPGSTTTHRFGTWSVATAGLPPCGYVVRLDSTDRTNLNCGDTHRDDDSVGFCLRAPAP